jgi:hypothetical protein
LLQWVAHVGEFGLVLRPSKSTLDRHGRFYLKNQSTNSVQNFFNLQASNLRKNNSLVQLPIAAKQAHERIMGERQVKSFGKILSFYGPEF